MDRTDELISNIATIRQNIEKNVDEIERVRAKALTEGRGNSGKDNDQVERLLDEIDVLEARHDQTCRSLGWDGTGKAADWLDSFDEARGGGRPPVEDIGGGCDLRNVGGPAKDKTFRGMFYGNTRKSLDSGGFRDGGEFLEAVASRKYDPRLKRSSSGYTGMQEDTPSLGGFSVPEEMAAEWLDASLPDEVIRPNAKVWPMKSAVKKIPGWDSLDQSSSFYGGFALQWLGEGATATRQTGKLRLIQLAAKKAAIFAQASNELLADGMSFREQLTIAMRESLTRGMDYYFIHGQGAGQPLGIVNNPALITVDKETGQGADTIIAENIAKMYARMWDGGRARAVWLANATTLPMLMKLYWVVGASGFPMQPVLMREGTGYSILGNKVLFTPCMSAVGDLYDIAFVDLQCYNIGMRKELALDTSNSPGWTEDITDFRVIMRLDAQGSWDKVLTPRNGDTQSWVVTLAERA